MNILAAALSILLSGWPSCCSQGSAWVPAIMDANSGDVASSNMVRLHASAHPTQVTSVPTEMPAEMSALSAKHSGPAMLGPCAMPGRASNDGHKPASSGMLTHASRHFWHGLIDCHSMMLSISCFVLCLSRAVRSISNAHAARFFQRQPEETANRCIGLCRPRGGYARVCTPQRCSRPACPETTCPQRMQPCCSGPSRLL